MITIFFKNFSTRKHNNLGTKNTPFHDRVIIQHIKRKMLHKVYQLKLRAYVNLFN